MHARIIYENYCITTGIMSKIVAFGEALEVGTRAHWDEITQSLYYVDVPLSEVYKYHPGKNLITKAKVGSEPLGFAFPTNEPNKFIASLGRKFVFFTWDGNANTVANLTPIAEVETEPHLSSNRINGGKVDPSGRLWAGTMGPSDASGQTEPGKASLYSITKGTVKKHDTNIGISNGLAFNVKLSKMYYIDTLFKGIFEYDYNATSGEISNKRVIFELEKHGIAGLPDGLTIDENGNLWLAVIFGSAILHINPKSGELLKKIEMPTSEITAVSWGDPALTTLYVNTAKMQISGKTPPHPAGCTFKITELGTAGLPGDRYQL